MTRIRLCLLCGLFFAAGACGNPNLAPLMNDQTALHLIKSARLALLNEGRDETGSGRAVGVIVTIYDGEGQRASVGVFGDEVTDCVNRAAARLGKTVVEKDRLDPAFLSIHILRDLRPVRWARLRDSGFGYHRGLYSVMQIKNGETRAFTDVDMHVQGLSVAAAIRRLDQDKGTALFGKAPAQGVFLAATESFTHDEQGGLVRLYRASTLLPKAGAAQIMQGVRLGGDFLCGLLRDDNRFIYEGDVGRDHYDNTYNQLRHSGTIYALYQLYEATGEERYRQTADRAWQWLLKQLRTDRDAHGNVCAFTVEVGKVKLGSSGLALIALSERLRINRTEADLKLGRELANHLLRGQNENGSFNSYHPLKGKKTSRYRSIYYPGEAMLGLIRFYHFDPNPAYLNAVAKGAHYLIYDKWRVIGLELFVLPDAWLMLALNDLHQVQPREDYVDYGLKIADGMMADQLLAGWQTPYPDYRGGYFPYPPQVTPAGARLEGLTATYLMARRAGRDVAALRRTIAEAARFEVERVIRPEFVFLYPNPHRALGAFRNSPISNRVRIDFNQHNISGLLVAAKILVE